MTHLVYDPEARRDPQEPTRPILSEAQMEAYLATYAAHREQQRAGGAPGNSGDPSGGTQSNRARSAGAKTDGKKKSKPSKQRKYPIGDLRAYLERHQIAWVSETDTDQGAHLFRLEHCPWQPEHDGAFVAQYPETGNCFAGCHHTGCAGKGLGEFRDVVEPGWDTPREPDEDGDVDEDAPRESKFERARQALDAKFFAHGPDPDGATTAGDPDDEAAAHDPAHAVTERFRDTAGTTYMTVPVGSDAELHHETMPIMSDAAMSWIQYQAYLSGEMLSDRDISMMQSHYHAVARYEGPVREVAHRVWQPPNDDYTVWIDVGDPLHRAIRVTAAGYSVIHDPPVKFIRRDGVLPFPLPVAPALEPGESVAQYLERRLRRYINIVPARQVRNAQGEWITVDHDWVLLVCWLLSALRQQGPFVVLALCGEKGSAKSTLGRILLKLVDPNKAELQGKPGDERAMAISASNCWVLAYDNLSYLRDEQSDILCRMSTGGSLRIRQLYTDDRERIFTFQRPVLVTSITEVVVKPDLLDRTIMVNLVVIPEERRCSERRLYRDFEADRPMLMGALFSLLADTLRHLPNVPASNLTRMADFAEFAVAVERAMNWPEGTFAAAAQHLKDTATNTAVEGSPVWDLLLRFINDRRGWDYRVGQVKNERIQWVDQPQQVLWRGTMSELYHALRKVGQEVSEFEDHWESHRAGWPKNPQALARKLVEIASYLRDQKLSVDNAVRLSDRRVYEIHDRRSKTEIEQLFATFYQESAEH